MRRTCRRCCYFRLPQSRPRADADALVCAIVGIAHIAASVGGERESVPGVVAEARDVGDGAARANLLRLHAGDVVVAVVAVGDELHFVEGGAGLRRVVGALAAVLLVVAVGDELTVGVGQGLEVVVFVVGESRGERQTVRVLNLRFGPVSRVVGVCGLGATRERGQGQVAVGVDP